MSPGLFPSMVLGFEKESPEALLQKLFHGFKEHSEEPTDLLRQAFEFGKKIHAEQVRESGAPYLTHPLIVAWLLLPYHPDRDTLIATILHDAFEDSNDRTVRSDVRREFGENVASLIEGVSKISKEYPDDSTLTANEETIRKMFRHAEKDVRIILIKLADRLHNIITLETKKDEEKRRRKAQETLDIFVPVAARLGLWELKTHLEESCFTFLYPAEAKQLQIQTEEHKEDAVEMFSSISATVRGHFSSAEILSVTKQNYDLPWLYARNGKQISPEETFFVKLVVPSEEDCYRVLTKLGRLYTSKTRELKDYTTSSKDNGYRALHTSMIVDGSFAVRFHILTKEMDERNMQGIALDLNDAAHLHSFFQHLRTIDRATRKESSRFIEAIQGDMLAEKILIHHEGGKTYVPSSSSALDAIFLLFPEKALKVESVLVNGKPAAFYYELEQNDVIKPVFADDITATIHWMPYLYTTQARLKLQSFLKREERGAKISLGQVLLQTEFDRYGRGEVSAKLSANTTVIRRFRVESFEELCILAAEGLVLPSEVLTQISDTGGVQRPRLFLERLREKFFPSDSSLRLKVRGQESGSHTIQETVRMLCKKYAIASQRFSLTQADGLMFEARLQIQSDDKGNLDAFFLALRDQEQVSAVIPLMPPSLKKQLATVLAFAGVMWAIYLFSLSRIIGLGEHSLLNYLAVVPVLFGHFVAYRFVSNYLPLVRSSRWFIFLVFGVNALVISLLAATLLIFQLDIFNFSLFFPLTLLVLSSLAVLYIFLQRRAVLPNGVKPLPTTITAVERKRQKILGYGARFLAVIIWGLEPLFIKYTLVNTIDPSTRVFLKAAGGLVPSLLIGFFIFPLLQRRKAEWKLPYNKLFAILIIGEILFTYLINSSLIYTSSTNVILLNNFAPVIALIIAAILWRDSIPYLKKNKYVAAIFLTFVLGSLGSTLLFYNDIKFATQGHVYGDFLGTLTMLVDVFLVIAMIRYVKSLPSNKSVELNFNIFLFSLIVTAPIALLGAGSVWHLSGPQILFGIGAGILSGCGRILNFEAFRRIDGFLAFLMFNISIFLTFTVETFLLNRIVPTIILLIGGLLIISSSVVAEYINSKSEKESS
ncbi:MAG: HD domain-containing protein [Candidatus Peregrinibacteria bacterium]|nr:HD domain-containing protein [Candidatus Peregrinibacteria bacterium]